MESIAIEVLYLIFKKKMNGEADFNEIDELIGGFTKNGGKFEPCIRKDGINLYEQILSLNLDMKDFYMINKIFSKYSSLFKDYKINEDESLIYDLSLPRTSSYYIKVLKLILDIGISDEAFSEIFRRYNIERDEMFSKYYDKTSNEEERFNNYKEYLRYFYYTYLLLISYLKDYKEAKLLININFNYDILKLRDAKGMEMHLKLKKNKMAVDVVSFYDKETKEFVCKLR